MPRRLPPVVSPIRRATLVARTALANWNVADEQEASTRKATGPSAAERQLRWLAELSALPTSDHSFIQAAGRLWAFAVRPPLARNEERLRSRAPAQGLLG